MNLSHIFLICFCSLAKSLSSQEKSTAISSKQLRSKPFGNNEVKISNDKFQKGLLMENPKKIMDIALAQSLLKSSPFVSSKSVKAKSPVSTLATTYNYFIISGYSNAATCDGTLMYQGIIVPNVCFPVNEELTSFAMYTNLQTTGVTGSTYDNAACSGDALETDIVDFIVNECEDGTINTVSNSLPGVTFEAIEATSYTTYESCINHSGEYSSYTLSNANQINGLGNYQFGQCINTGDGYGSSYSCTNDGELFYSAYNTSDCSNAPFIASAYPNTCEFNSTLTTGFIFIGCAYPITVAPTIKPTANPTVNPTANPTNPTFTPTSAPGDSSTCFSGFEMVEIDNGASKMLSEVIVGDRVLAYSPSARTFVYSDVIAVPHLKNDVRTTFQQISVENGEQLHATPEHLIFAGSCEGDLELMQAQRIQRGHCLMSTTGKVPVVANVRVSGKGVYTIVTNEEYVVVNGFVASPFALSHTVGNMFYNLHRFVFAVLPSALKTSVFAELNAAADYVANTFVSAKLI